jgi:hypothetical protein
MECRTIWDCDVWKGECWTIEDVLEDLITNLGDRALRTGWAGIGADLAFERKKFAGRLTAWQ